MDVLVIECKKLGEAPLYVIDDVCLVCSISFFAKRHPPFFLVFGDVLGCSAVAKTQRMYSRSATPPFACLEDGVRQESLLALL